MATGATEFIDNTVADVFIPEIWSALAIEARFQRLVYTKCCDGRYASEMMKMGDILNVPSRTHLTAQSKARNTNAAVVFETQTETNTQITIATWEYSAIAVESIIKVQGNRDMLSFYASEMGYALDLALDDVLAGLVDDRTNVVGTLTSPLTYEDWLRARQYLDDANAPDDDRYICIAPAEEANTMKLDQFINRDYTDMMGAQKKGDPDYGWIGHWLSMPIYKSTNIEGSNAAGHDNSMHHRSAYAFIRQMQPTSHHQYDINYFVDKVAMENLYGTAAMRDLHGVFCRGA